MKALYEYQLLDAIPAEELPKDYVEFELFKDESLYFGCWGRVVYERPLTGAEVDHYNLDGPIRGWM